MASDHAVGVVVGLAAEARIARRLGWVVAIGGGTSHGAELAARRLIDAGVSALISFGLAGGLDPALPAGTLLVPASVLVGEDSYATDTSLSGMLGNGVARPLLGGAAVLASVADKRRLHAATGASAVDLESGAVAAVAAAYSLPFAVLRAICDPAARALPPAALVALDSSGAIGVWRVAAALAAQPGQLPALVRLAADAAAARRALAARVRQLSRQPPVLAAAPR